MTTIPTPGRSGRNPTAIRADFENAINGLADISAWDCLWEIIEDIIDSARLAMSNLDEERREEILDEIKSYAVNHYD